MFPRAWECRAYQNVPCAQERFRMKQREQWRSRAGRGLSLSELAKANGFCWNRLWDTQEREIELLCSLKSLWMERLDKELHNGPESQGSSWLLSMFQHWRHTSRMLQKHSTGGCIRPEKQRNQTIIGTGLWDHCKSLFKRLSTLHWQEQTHPKTPKTRMHTVKRGACFRGEEQGDRRILTMARHRGQCMCHKGLATQNLLFLLHKPDNNTSSSLYPKGCDVLLLWPQKHLARTPCVGVLVRPWHALVKVLLWKCGFVLFFWFLGGNETAK